LWFIGLGWLFGVLFVGIRCTIFMVDFPFILLIPLAITGYLLVLGLLIKGIL